MCDGFCAELCGEPSSKSQSHETGLPMDWSVNYTISGTIPKSGLAVKSTVKGDG